jgi:hypothetical protein
LIRLGILDPSGLIEQDSATADDSNSLRRFVAKTAAASAYYPSPLDDGKDGGTSAESDSAFLKLQDRAIGWAAQQVKLIQLPAPAKDSTIMQTINDLSPLIELAKEDKDYSKLDMCRVCSTSWQSRNPPDIFEKGYLGTSEHKPQCYLQPVLNWAVTHDELKPLPGFFQRNKLQVNDKRESYTYHIETERPEQVFQSTKPLHIIPIWKDAECK